MVPIIYHLGASRFSITIMRLNVSHNVSSERAIENCYMTYVVRSPSSSYVINSLVGCVVNAIFAIFGTFLNSLVVCVFWKTPKLRRKICYFMIMVLSSVDICVSIIVHPLHLVSSIAEITETSKCLYKMIYQTSAVIFSGMSTMTFFVMNIERYFSIVHPFFHRIHVSKRKCLMFSCIWWFICITTAVVPIFGVKINIFVTLLAHIVCLGTLFIYISIFYVARKSRSKTNEQIKGDTMAEESRKEREICSRNKSSLSQDIRLAKTYLLVVFCSLFCYAPNAVVLAIWRERLTTIDGVVQVKIWTVSLVAMNSTLNSLIFFWSNQTLRNEGFKVLKGLFKKS